MQREMTLAMRAYHDAERAKRHAGKAHRRSALVAPAVSDNENVQHGYSVTRRGEVVFSCRCVDCELRTCECVLKALQAARARGAGVTVYGPGGRVLQRSEAE